jgi:hypothetical protein
MYYYIQPEPGFRALLTEGGVRVLSITTNGPVRRDLIIVQDETST